MKIKVRWHNIGCKQIEVGTAHQIGPISLRFSTYAEHIESITAVGVSVVGLLARGLMAYRVQSVVLLAGCHGAQKTRDLTNMSVANQCNCRRAFHLQAIAIRRNRHSLEYGNEMSYWSSGAARR